MFSKNTIAPPLPHPDDPLPCLAEGGEVFLFEFSNTNFPSHGGKSNTPSFHPGWNKARTAVQLSNQRNKEKNIRHPTLVL